ncbi:MAG: hypothetical protein QOJ93_2254, partial [Actinomycetota bacterium]|nr:hypothetical protein [Actinomycetota bacterium]
HPAARRPSRAPQPRSPRRFRHFSLGESSPVRRRQARWRVGAPGPWRDRCSPGRGDPTRRTCRLGGRPHGPRAASSTCDLVRSGQSSSLEPDIRAPLRGFGFGALPGRRRSTTPSGRASLRGDAVQLAAPQLARNPKGSTIKDRESHVRRFQCYTNGYPVDVAPRATSRSSPQNCRGCSRPSTLPVRTYQGAIRQFLEYASDLGWAQVCQQLFGNHPSQICFKGTQRPPRRNSRAGRRSEPSQKPNSRQARRSSLTLQ